MTFERWMDKVNDEFIEITGLDRDSWPDSLYHDAWANGVSPRGAVIQCIEEEYGEMGLEAFGVL